MVRALLVAGGGRPCATPTLAWCLPSRSSYPLPMRPRRWVNAFAQSGQQSIPRKSSSLSTRPQARDLRAHEISASDRRPVMSSSSLIRTLRSTPTLSSASALRLLPIRL